ncbi:hypothetical protein [Nocardiopsis nanhaiensis]
MNPRRNAGGSRSAIFEKKGHPTPTKYLRQAGGAVVVAGAVSWLSADGARVHRVERLGSALNEEIFDDRLWQHAKRQGEGEPPARAEYGRAIAGHFWCDLLIEIANALDQGARLVNRVPEELTDAVLEHEDAEKWDPLRTELTEDALNLLWKSAHHVLGTDLAFPAVYLRVLAVLICLDPGAHPRVARGGLRPLATETLGDHLQTNVEPEWLWEDPR